MWIAAIGLASPPQGRAQVDRPRWLDFEFTVLANERLRDVAYVQLKESARGKPRPTASDFDVIPMRVISQGRSDTYHYVGPPPLRFVLTSGVAETLAVDRVIATVAEPVSAEQSLFVLIANSEGAYSLLALDDGRSAHAEREIRLLNLSNHRISGSLDGQTFELDESRRAYPPESVDRNVHIGIAFERHNRPVVVFDQSVSVGENERILLVLLPPIREGADVRTRVVRDQFRRSPVAGP